MNKYACPTCGWFHEDFEEPDPSLIRTANAEKLYYWGSEIPGWAEKWQEFHKCPKCGTEYNFETSNY